MTNLESKFEAFKRSNTVIMTNLESKFGAPQEQKTPVILKMKNPGDKARGVFCDVDVLTLSGKRVPAYILAQVDDNLNRTGEKVQFLQTADLKKKLTRDALGHFVTVEVTGTEPTGNGPMVVYKVVVYGAAVSAPVTAPAALENGITDADLPF